MAELRNVGKEQVFIPGIDLTLAPDEAVEIDESQVESVQNPLLTIDGKTSVTAELGQVDAADDDTDPTGEHVDQSPSEGTNP